MTEREIYERLGRLEARVQHLYEKTGIAVPDWQTIAQTQVSPEVRELMAAGKKAEAVRAYRQATGVDLATAVKTIDAL